jgi:tRNA threonylcarbamoyladenosine biosynthesis protein TsaE
MREHVTSTSAVETRSFAASVAARARPGEVYALVGPLGAGKTEFVRGFVRRLSSDVPVRSPSFTLLNIYRTPEFPVYHFDFYRLNAAAELTEVGLAEYLGGEGVCLIEWADMFAEELPPADLQTITFALNADGSREICLT